jgi:hypothetical protein
MPYNELLATVGEWYYIGHYGQLGPLTREQMDELVTGGVINRDTYVWRNGMSDWVFAERCTELMALFAKAEPFSAPPPKPTAPTAAAPPPRDTVLMASAYDYTLRQPNAYYPSFGRLKSDRSRTAAGVLQLFLPGIGRMYLGYPALGVIQLALAIVTCGFLHIWSFIDGILILTGGLKFDGYGRELSD